MVGLNYFPLLSLVTITVLLLFIPCLTTADPTYGPKKDDIPVPKPDNCAQYNETDLRISFLAQHNLARKQFGIPSLVWDEAVANYSRNYTQLRRSDCKLIHSHGDYGENLFWGSGDCWTVDQIAQAWLIEMKDYDYPSNKCRPDKVCGHYTQIVWRNTKRLGCAVVICDNNLGTFAICNYDPPGNYVGMWPY